MVIAEFRGEHAFLSNYFSASFIWRNVEFSSAEQAFAWAKTIYAKDDVTSAKYALQILATDHPGEAKKLGRQMPINVADWDKYKNMYMRELVHAKFLQNTSGIDLVGKLINTGPVMLVEGNDWNDTYWGRCKNKEGRWVGLNTLGVILMEERGWWSRGDKDRP